VSETTEHRGVLIIGTGLIGTSIGLALRAHGIPVFLRDRTSSHALVAAGLGAGVVDTGSDVELVIVAVPPSMASTVVAEALSEFPQATVTDVASVKSTVVDQVEALGADLSRYVGSHPMAGSHRSGPLTARADLFVDRTWVIAAHHHTDPTRVDQVRAIAEICGARLEMMDPTEHDRAVAEISHVPQILSSLMAGNLIEVEPSHLRLAGQGVRDLTRIAASDEQMWTQIIVANQDAIRVELMKLSAALTNVSDHLDSVHVVSQFIRNGVEGTRVLPGKHGRTADDYVYIVIEIPDSPGALARLFADVDAAGVNVEDLGIEHDPSREVGFISIAGEAVKADDLAHSMARAGWRLKS
jgi:prephenate dehydrogenase